MSWMRSGTQLSQFLRDFLPTLGVDSRNCAVLDSACSSTVCGKLWLDGYLKSLDKEDQIKVYQTEGVKIWRRNKVKIRGVV